MNPPAGTPFARALMHGLDLGDRGCAFERCVISGPNTEQDDVVVVVDEPGNDRAAAQVDLPRAGTETLIAALTDSRESTVLNRHLRTLSSPARPS